MDRTRENSAEGATPSVGEGMAAAAQGVGEAVEQGRQALAEFQSAVAEKTRECVESTELYIRENPWQAVGIASAVGVIVGLLLARR